MKIEEIKEKYTCLDYLGEPLKKTANGYLYRAPWRTDNHPSLSVTKNGRGWHDLATGDHGSIIDLVMRCLNTTDVRRACEELLRANPSFSFSQPLPGDGQKEERTFTRFEVVPLRSRVLYSYIYKRGVSIPIVKEFLHEAHYSFRQEDDGKYLYALAYANDLGGYELRGAPWAGCPDGYKGGTQPKGITTHRLLDNAPTVVFEGFFDFLSFATLCGGVRHNYIVLNSIVNTPMAIDALKDCGGKIYLALDNDQGGETATRQLLDALPSAIDIRNRFTPYKDVNDYLCHIIAESDSPPSR